MRNGRKPQRDRDRAFEVASSVGQPQVETHDLPTLTPQAADEPAGLQLALDSFDPLDEPAEVLIRVSTEALEGDSDLVDDGGNGGENDDEIENLTGHERVAVEAGIVEAVEDGIRTAELSAPPLPYEPAEPVPLDDPVLQMRLARIHLKTGSLTIARAELEALAARNQLDTPAHLDLAEARWRTGDLDGAGEAAGAYMDGGGDEALGFVIAAEASAMANRHAEARRHTEQALERHLSELDPMFAGIPRRAVWALPAWSAATSDALAVPSVRAPADQVQSDVAQAEPQAAEPVELEPEAEPEPVELAAEPVELEPEAEPEPVELAAEPLEPEAEPEPVELAAEPLEPEPEPEPVELAAEPLEPEPEPEPVELAAEPLEPEAEPEPVELAAEPVELEPEVEPVVPPIEPEPEPEMVEPDAMVVQAEAEPPAEEPAVEAAPNDVQATAEVASGRSYLEAGDPMMAALHFGVAIRMAPASATSVLDAIGDRQELPLQLVRGDALRLLGMEGDAGKAYQSVANALGAPKPVPPEPPAPASDEPEPEPPAESAESAFAEPPPIRWA
jgi:hypothetical protein